MTATRPAPSTKALPVAWTSSIDDYAASVAYSRDGSLCAVGGAAGDVVIYDATTGSVRWRSAAHAGGLLGLAWSPIKNLLATCGQDGTAKVFAGESGSVVAVLPGTSKWVELLAWSATGRLATASGKSVRLWREDFSPLLETEAHASTVTGLQWNRRGDALATCCFGGLYIWTVKERAEARHYAWKGSLISLAWSPDDKVVACASQDCSVHFWRVPRGRDSEMTGYPFKSRALSWDSNGSLLATSGDAVITLWDFAGKGPEGTKPIRLEAHQAQVVELAFSPRKAVIASGAQDTGVILWEPRKSQRPLAFAFLSDCVSGLGWHPQHKSLTAIDASGNIVTFLTD